MLNTNLISRVGEIFVPLLKESIIETGRITPEEFIASGDNLTQKFLSWSWQGVPMPSHKASSLPISWPLGHKVNGVSYLPPDKQYLMAKRVLCLSRASASSSNTKEDQQPAEAEFTSISSEEAIIDNDPVCFWPTNPVGPDDSPLSHSQIYEDISAEHARKTVTIESHPFLPLSTASIHPCRHASVMCSMIKMLKGTAGAGSSVPFPSER
ncbi:autophagy-related protein 3 [Mitosporidium daphniae]|uniref:Autophagy-related protein 3 n=1 Tax=Mitosporidium daphniae TaxID=1485682 RepID=A0A098VT53_9MICR|nr:autophagy-related protein 3 [Mitosporidium daphniae]KGG51979.1 autophagy-related protein 3 [Mitosporidium daphniae]|eukprot:XP_013238435.1 autophagy-related protein 3 [Mitosporidium daphniae]